MAVSMIFYPSPPGNASISPARWLFLAMLLAFLPAALLAQPAVTDVRASQRADGSGLVDIHYNLSGADGPMMVSVFASPDNGQTWNVTPAPQHLSGAAGSGIVNGVDHHIVWDAWTDRPGAFWPQAQVEIVASSGGGDELTITLPGGVPLVLAGIPAGAFVMGSPPGERGRSSSEGPQTHVTISQGFYMGKHEVTQAQWQALMGSNPSDFQGANRPVEMVSWDDAQDFIAALNLHIATTAQGPAAMRLPTEAEWEYAARARTATRFHFGDSLSVGDSCEDDGIRSQYMWYCGNSGGQTHPVGQKLPNAFGLHDMHGNVNEWVQDWYDTYPGGSVTDPTGPPSGSDRVVRGGGWDNLGHARICRSAQRNAQAPWTWYDGFGFRLASGQEVAGQVVSRRSPAFHLDTRVDTCDRATVITGNGAYSFNTTGASGTDPCGSGIPTVWYRFTAPAAGTVSADLCTATSFDTYLTVFAGAACPTGCSERVVWNDDSCGLQSRVAFNAVAGQTYHFAVSGLLSYHFGPGVFTFAFTPTEPVEGDTCDTATVVTENGAYPFDTTGASGSDPCRVERPTVWYRFTAPSNGEVSADLCGSSFDTWLTVFQGDECPTCGDRLEEDNASCAVGRITFPASAGQTYWFAASGWGSGDFGPGVFNFTFTPESAIFGDINGDGVVNVADVTTLANLIAAGSAPPVEAGDINGDGEVNWWDVAALAESIANE